MKEAKGNPGRRPIVRVADAARGLSAAPRELRAPEARIWAALAPELERLKFLRETDRSAFARYCVHLATWWRMTKDLRTEGETYLAKSEHVPDGLMRVNPKFLIRERVEKRLELLEDRFGLSPATRQQILHRLAMTTLPGAGAANQGTGGGDLVDQAERPAPPGATPGAEGSPVGMLRRHVH